LARLRSDFVAVTSHELRTPLTAVTGYAQLLQTRWFELSDAQKRERLGRIVAAAARQQQLVESLLLLSDLDAGIPILARNTVLVQPLMQQAATEITAVYPDQQIDLAGPATLGVVGDAKYIANIVAAVLDNAAKHSPAGRPIAVNWMAEGDMAVIRVRDYGPGVPEDGHAYLFTLFGRLPGSSMRAGRVGTGLGLYLGRQMAEAMDGDLDLEETGSEGSTFRARLPLAPTTP
jgi:two-component system OmpR family sensor kinase